MLSLWSPTTFHSTVIWVIVLKHKINMPVPSMIYNLVLNYFSCFIFLVLKSSYALKLLQCPAVLLEAKPVSVYSETWMHPKFIHLELGVGLQVPYCLHWFLTWYSFTSKENHSQTCNNILDFHCVISIFESLKHQSMVAYLPWAIMFIETINNIYNCVISFYRSIFSLRSYSPKVPYLYLSRYWAFLNLV